MLDRDVAWWWFIVSVWCPSFRGAVLVVCCWSSEINWVDWVDWMGAGSVATLGRMLGRMLDRALNRMLGGHVGDVAGGGSVVSVWCPSFRGAVLVVCMLCD